MPGFVLGPDGGAAYGSHGSRVLIKASGEQTRGMFYVIAGELTGTFGDDTWSARAGSFVFVPRDTPHSLSVTSTEPATALVITGPPQLDRQIAARSEPPPAVA